jgi:hypothetical protein
MPSRGRYQLVSILPLAEGAMVRVMSRSGSGCVRPAECHLHWRFSVHRCTGRLVVACESTI